MLVLDIVRQDLEAVELSRRGRSERRDPAVAGLGHLARRACGVVGHGRGPAVVADDAPALPERVDVAAHPPHVGKRGAGKHHKLEVDGHEMLGDNVQTRLGQQVVDVGHTPGDRILDRDHRQVGVATLYGGERVLEGLTPDWLHAR